MSEVELVALPGVDRAGADGLDRSRRRHAARGRCGRARRLRVRGRPDVGRGVVHRRQHRDERRRQEGGAVGHGARQPGVVAHGDARGEVARGRCASTTTSARSTTPRWRSFELRYFDAERQDARAHRAARHPRQRVPQGRPRQGRHRQVPRRPARHPEGRLRRPDHVGALGRAPHAGARAHRVPRVLRQRQGRGAVDRRDQGLHVRRPAQAAARSWPASSTSTTATSRRSATPPRASAAGCRRWC